MAAFNVSHVSKVLNSKFNNKKTNNKNCLTSCFLKRSNLSEIRFPTNHLFSICYSSTTKKYSRHSLQYLTYSTRLEHTRDCMKSQSVYACRIDAKWDVYMNLWIYHSVVPHNPIRLDYFWSLTRTHTHTQTNRQIKVCYCIRTWKLLPMSACPLVFSTSNLQPFRNGIHFMRNYIPFRFSVPGKG